MTYSLEYFRRHFRNYLQVHERKKKLTEKPLKPHSFNYKHAFRAYLERWSYGNCCHHNNSQEKDDTLTCSLLLDFQYNHLSVAPGPRSSYILLDAEIKANTSHFEWVMADIVASIIHTEKWIVGQWAQWIWKCENEEVLSWKVEKVAGEMSEEIWGWFPSLTSLWSFSYLYLIHLAKCSPWI